MTKDDLDPGQIFVLRDFLTADECATLIARSESLAFEKGKIGNAAIVEDFRNNDRVSFDDHALAAEFFARSRPFLPAAMEERPLVGFHEHWRFYRYGPGQTFKPHRDGRHTSFGTWDESRVTFMIYLNEGMAGGETNFFAGMEEAFQNRPYLSVRPQAGMALVFVHEIWHEGAVVQSGEKYVLRTDVMYGRSPKA